MSRWKKIRKIAAMCQRPGNFFCSTRYLLILSHMRSRSSVLSHVLGSNPEICGHSELHISYRRNRLALLVMRAIIYSDTKDKFAGRYLLDKVLHNNYELPPDLLAAMQPKVLFLIREPGSTLRSTIKMGDVMPDFWFSDPDRITDYYCQRLAKLQEYADLLGSGYFFVDSDELIEQTESVLSRMSGWLRLKQPLSQEYSLFESTGKSGKGDPSSNLSAGVLKKTSGHDDVQIADHLLRRAEDAYQECRRRFAGTVAT